jgi:hypothetical protein
MRNIIGWSGNQWHDVKGNAKWDFIKWGGVLVIPLLHKYVDFLEKGPFWCVFLKSALNAAVLVLAYRVLRTQMKMWAQARSKKEGDRLAIAKQNEWLKNRGRT